YILSPQPTASFPLSLHDALPICAAPGDGDHGLLRPQGIPAGRGRRLPLSAPLTHEPIIQPVPRALRELDDDALAARTALQRLLRSEEHTSELQSRFDLVCRLLLE